MQIFNAITMKRSSSSSSSSNVAKRRSLQNPVNNNIDRITNLPDDVLKTILSKLSTIDAVKTSILSTRWQHLWWWRPHLAFDVRDIVNTTFTQLVPEACDSFAQSITKAMNNHCGNLESCTIHHYMYQCEDGTLENWIQTATRVKHTKELTLANHICYMGSDNECCELNIAPDAFSHHSLTSLSLNQFKLIGTHGFNNCSNLKTLKLLNIIAEVSVLSSIFAACSSLEILLLQINLIINENGVLKIENNNLKYLQISSPYKVDRIEIYSTSLDVLDLRCVYSINDNIILECPNIKINMSDWIVGGFPHLSYNITELTQEKKSILHELMVKRLYGEKRYGSLSVIVDMTNPKEVDILKEVLLMWNPRQMTMLEILFKNNDDATGEEGECSINGRGHRTLRQMAKPFPNAQFRVYSLWMYNFSGSGKEFALALQFMRHKTVIDKIMIETSSLPPTKRLKVEAAVTKLKAIRTGNKYFSIQCF